LIGVPSDRTRQFICARVAKLLKEERLRQGVSMSELARQAGLSQQMVSYVERGMRMPTLDTLLRIAEVMKMPLWKVLKASEEAH
jgi:transcriptional regulator with XRE-family HTH domain